MNREHLEKIVLDNSRKDSFDRRDICTIYRNREGMKEIVSYLAEPFRGKVDYVVAPESLGFILGSMLADELDVGFIPARNGDIAILASDDAIRSSYIDHRDHARSLQMRRSNFPKGSRVVIVDDWIETAVTIRACAQLIEEAQGSVVGYASIGADINPRTAKMLADGTLRCVLCKG